MINKKTLSEAYVDRDLSWMYFNRRILQEAAKPQVPLLERLSFLGIYSNNLDEFFRVRMATLGRIAECEDKSLRSERERLYNKVRQLEQEIGLLENNIGFFAKSKNAEALVADVKAKIDRAREEMAAAIEKVKLIDRQAQEENQEHNENK